MACILHEEIMIDFVITPLCTLVLDLGVEGSISEVEAVSEILLTLSLVNKC